STNFGRIEYWRSTGVCLAVAAPISRCFDCRGQIERQSHLSKPSTGGAFVDFEGRSERDSSEHPLGQALRFRRRSLLAANSVLASVLELAGNAIPSHAHLRHMTFVFKSRK